MTFIDSDDMYHTDRLKIMYSVFEQNPECDAVFVDFKEFKGDISINETVGLGKTELIDKDILKNVISDKKAFCVQCDAQIGNCKEGKICTLAFCRGFLLFQRLRPSF